MPRLRLDEEDVRARRERGPGPADERVDVLGVEGLETGGAGRLGGRAGARSERGEERHARAGGLRAEAPVRLQLERAELEHVAEHRHRPRGGPGEIDERAERGGHRDGVRVVAVVHEPEPRGEPVEP